MEYLVSGAGWLSLLGKGVEVSLTGTPTENLLVLRRRPLQSSDVLFEASVVVDERLLLLAYGHYSPPLVKGSRVAPSLPAPSQHRLCYSFEAKSADLDHFPPSDRCPWQDT